MKLSPNLTVNDLIHVPIRFTKNLVMELQIKINSKIDDIQKKLRECNFECNRLKEYVDQALPQLKVVPTPVPPTVIPELPAVVADEPVSKTEISAPTAPPEARTPAQSPESRPIVPPLVNAPTTRPTAPKTSQNPKPTKPEAPAIKNSRNLEEFIGGNLLNKIGIGILIIGIGIFVKYAIDQDWIGAIGRVLVGLASGGILLGIAHRIRKTYKAFSSVLMGGGIAVLYFSVAIAYHTYGLLGQTPAFALMSIITAFAVLFSIAYNRMEIGIIALIGGFASPFMVSNGSGNYITLFSYILLLNIGMMVLSWFRDWKPIRILSYLFTLILVGGWLAMNLINSNLSVLSGTLTFSSLFFIVFFAMNIAFNVKTKKPLGALEFIMILSNSMFYYISAMFILHDIDAGKYMGLFTAVMAAFHFAFIFPIRKYIQPGRNLQLLLIGLVLTFITLAIPIQLKGSFITLFWAAEAIILFILAKRANISFLRTSSQIVSLLTIISVSRDWVIQYWDTQPSGRIPILNGAFLTTLLTAGSMIALYTLYKRSKDTTISKQGFIYQFIALPILYLGILFELIDHTTALGSSGLVTIAIITYTALFLTIMQLWALKDKRKTFGHFIIALSLLTFLAYCSAHFGPIAEMRNDFAYSKAENGFPWHLLMLPGIFSLLALNFKHLSRNFSLNSNAGKIILWATALIFLILSSLELDNLMVMVGFQIKTAHKVGYPILWGISAFAFILIGMRKQLLALRIAGLGLFCLILVKLFAYDIREVSPGGKIAAFISLGLLLLVISFMYQKLKKLLFPEENEAE
ncbi:MAG TPA: DUF2339 domain-containing protein [Bacteroidetes bacterium]|nr:DUF2339 domain-containing protein [Bacteroidota bacterium]